VLLTLDKNKKSLWPDMGASESTLIIKEERSSYPENNFIKTYSTKKSQNALTLYKIHQTERKHEKEKEEDYIENNLLNNYACDETQPHDYYIILLSNQNNTNYVFNMASFDNLQKAEERYRFVPFQIIYIIL